MAQVLDSAVEGAGPRDKPRHLLYDACEMCPEAQQLLSQFFSATSMYTDRTKRLRPVAIALLFKPESEAAVFDAALNQAQATRRECEKAREALQSHVITHGCC